MVNVNLDRRGGAQGHVNAERKAGIFEQVALAGAANSVGQTSSHPVDVMKTRLMMQGQGSVGGEKKYRGILSGLVVVAREEGFRGCYKGYQASILRELSYSGLRVGLYEPVKNLIGSEDSRTTPLWKKVPRMQIWHAWHVCVTHNIWRICATVEEGHGI